LCNFYIYVIYKYGRGPRRDADYPDESFSWQVLELYHEWATTASPKPLPVYHLSVTVFFYVIAQVFEQIKQHCSLAVELCSKEI